MRIKTTYGKTTRFFAKDEHGWHTTSADKAQDFTTPEEANQALAEIQKAYKGIEATIVPG